MQALGELTTTSKLRRVSNRDRLIREHADAARRIALRMARRCPDWISRDDIVSAGMVGLIEAADRYDESRQEPFIAFAEHRIRGAILDELRRGDIMPRRVRQLAREGRRRGNRPERCRLAWCLARAVPLGARPARAGRGRPARG